MLSYGPPSVALPGPSPPQVAAAAVGDRSGGGGGPRLCRSRLISHSFALSFLFPTSTSDWPPDLAIPSPSPSFLSADPWVPRPDLSPPPVVVLAPTPVAGCRGSARPGAPAASPPTVAVGSGAPWPGSAGPLAAAPPGATGLWMRRFCGCAVRGFVALRLSWSLPSRSLGGRGPVAPPPPL
ncbi:vegetative cell wall protein gp1-like [Panicum virgatum]|uniref:vegetative cell wall protein gp1-like n=1 Tax=Panicum virgatum TaxID=38727 RepID=UPI0019D6344C|nr:vegetative cell wall protein gp1-like [Panicum virgatum]